MVTHFGTETSQLYVFAKSHLPLAQHIMLVIPAFHSLFSGAPPFGAFELASKCFMTSMGRGRRVAVRGLPDKYGKRATRCSERFTVPKSGHRAGEVGMRRGPAVAWLLARDTLGALMFTGMLFVGGSNTVVVI
eukprot:2028729-Rhodomonas_salina.2